MSFEDRLKNSVGDWGSKTDKSIQELFYGYYPDLTKKEFAICEMIISARWDLGETFYNAIIATTPLRHKDLFHDEEEVEVTVRQLCEKGVVKKTLWFLRFGGILGCDSNSCERKFLRPVKLLDLKDEIADEAFKIFCTQFESSITEYFGPVEREDQ